MPEESFTFTRGERLKKRDDIIAIFSSGIKLSSFPFVALYTITDNKAQDSINFGISVPKKKHKTAVARNSVKRKCREAYRLHKHDICELSKKHNKHIDIMFIYVSPKKLDYSSIEKGMTKILNQLKNRIDDNKTD